MPRNGKVEVSKTQNKLHIRSLSPNDVRELNSKKDIKGFVSDAKLAQSPLASKSIVSKLDSDDQESGNIVAKDLVAFTKGVPLINRQDVTRSMLFAQQVANYYYNSNEQPVEWFNEFKNALNNLAWIVQDFGFIELDLRGRNITIDKAVLEIMGGIASGQEIELASSILDGMKSLDEADDRLVLWESQSHNQNAGGFHIGVATYSEGMVLYNPAVFYFTASMEIKKLLFFEFTGESAKASAAATTLAFDVGLYAQVRQQVTERLGNDISTYVKDAPRRGS